MLYVASLRQASNNHLQSYHFVLLLHQPQLVLSLAPSRNSNCSRSCSMYNFTKPKIMLVRFSMLHTDCTDKIHERGSSQMHLVRLRSSQRGPGISLCQRTQMGSSSAYERYAGSGRRKAMRWYDAHFSCCDCWKIVGAGAP